MLSETTLNRTLNLSSGDGRHPKSAIVQRRRPSRFARLLARHPTSYRALKDTIKSLLEETEWPLESREAAQDLLRIVQGLPPTLFSLNLDIIRRNPDRQSATYVRAVEDVWQKVKEASLMYDMQNGGRGARGCTKVLTACREKLLLSTPGTGLIPTPPSMRLRLPRASKGDEIQQQRSKLRVRMSAVSISSSATTSPSTSDVGQQCAGPGAEGPPASVSPSTASSGSVSALGTMITWISQMPVKVNGHFCDVFAGTHSRVGKVALKRPRIGTAGYNKDAIRRFQREAETWERLQHPHILEYLGTFQRDGHFYFVSPFIENGTLVEYIELYPSVNRVKLLSETADAVSYLHDEEIVHGDIKASNLLIGDNGQVLLCDFGLTRTTDFRTSTAMRGAGTLRWQSPELWNGSSKSFKSDVYAFGMTIVEVLTETIPFPDLETDGAVICAVLIDGRRPPKNPTASSAGLSYEKVWAIAEACWPAIPKERISMAEVLQLLHGDPALGSMQDV